MSTETKETITAKKQNVSSGGFTFTEWGVGSIRVTVMHYDHTSELETFIEIIDIAGSTEEEIKKHGWGKTIFMGKIAALIAIVTSKQPTLNEEAIDG